LVLKAEKGLIIEVILETPSPAYRIYVHHCLEINKSRAMSQSRDSETPSPQEEAGSSNTRTWKLEESSLWWLSLDVFQHPGNVLLMSSIPFVAGAFFGYKKPTEKLEELAGGRKRKKKKTDKVDVAALAEHRRLGLQTASRALRLATLGAVGSFGMLGAGE
jgi:hypothetical protein